MPSEVIDPEVAALAAKYDVYEVHKALTAKNIKTDYSPAKYPEFLPSTERGNNPGYHTGFEHVEPGTRADPAMPNLKGLPGYEEECVQHSMILVLRSCNKLISSYDRYITPRLGSIVKGYVYSVLNLSRNANTSLHVTGYNLANSQLLVLTSSHSLQPNVEF